MFVTWDFDLRVLEAIPALRAAINVPMRAEGEPYQLVGVDRVAGAADVVHGIHAFNLEGGLWGGAAAKGDSAKIGPGVLSREFAQNLITFPADSRFVLCGRGVVCPESGDCSFFLKIPE